MLLLPQFDLSNRERVVFILTVQSFQVLFSCYYSSEFTLLPCYNFCNKLDYFQIILDCKTSDASLQHEESVDGKRAFGFQCTIKWIFKSVLETYLACFEMYLNKVISYCLNQKQSFLCEKSRP